MKLLRAITRVNAFTLIELLVVVAIIVVLVAMVFPANPHEKTRSLSAACMNNQKQIAMGLLVWGNEHEDAIPRITNGVIISKDIGTNNFPWQISTNDGGTKELISNNSAVSQFLPLASFIKDSMVFKCPSDGVKNGAVDIGSLSESNISYFVNVDAALMNGRNTILTGDRHLQVGNEPVKPGLFVYTNGMAMGWTLELHTRAPGGPSGAMSFMDGHAEFQSAKPSKLTTTFDRQKMESERLLVP